MADPPLKATSPILNGILAAGCLLVIASVAGLTATAITHSCRDEGKMEARNVSGLHPERIRGKFGFADEAGALIIPARFDGADAFSEGLAVVLVSGRFGYIDARGEWAIPAVYRHARAFQDGHASVRFGDDWLVIDRGGTPIEAAFSAENAAP
jgi:hypothetical protein